jgi:heptosyltransferase-2
MTEPGPLIIRLRNWVGDVVLSVPTLQRLEKQGFELHLIGKGFAPALLRGFGWHTEKLAPSFWTRVEQLRNLGRTLTRQGKLPSSIIFPYSLSSALEARFAGLQACGFATEGRGLLLGQSLDRPRHGHTLDEYWALGDKFLGATAPAPTKIDWQITPDDVLRARELIAAHGWARTDSSGFIMAIPYSSGSFAGQSKHWPAFEQWIASAYRTHGCPIILCPGPGEEGMFSFSDTSGVMQIPAVDLGLFAALSKEARLIVSNDTGPGHLAAATGAPTLSVLGPTPIERWGVRGSRTRTLQQKHGWPTLAEIDRAASDMLHPRFSSQTQP